MLKSLLNTNLKPWKDAELAFLLRQTNSLREQIEQELFRRLSDRSEQPNLSYEKHADQKLFIKNGRKLSEHEIYRIDENEYDVVLDMTTTRLRYRKYPAKHTELKTAKLEGIGSCRIEVLAYLLEHPSRDISVESVSSLPKQSDIVDSSALSKTISLLRKTLEQKGAKGPYILTKEVWGRNYRYAYQIDDRWQYLVIKKK